MIAVPPCSGLEGWEHPSTKFQWFESLDSEAEFKACSLYVFDHGIAGPEQIDEAAEALAQELKRVRAEAAEPEKPSPRQSTIQTNGSVGSNRPLLFFGHGIGGCIVKSALAKAYAASRSAPGASPSPLPDAGRPARVPAIALILLSKSSPLFNVMYQLTSRVPPTPWDQL